MGVSKELAQMVVRAFYGDYTPELKKLAKKAVINGVAMTLAGSAAQAGTIAADLDQEFGGLPIAR